MIEINLLPGAGKKARKLGVSSGLSNAFSGVSSQIKDPYMMGAIASAVVCVLAVGGLWMTQFKSGEALRVLEEKAVQDSARFASVISEKRKAEAKRDSVVQQVRLIQAIDNDRYVWPHILAEVSKAVPSYTWIGEILFNTAARSPAATMPVDSAALRAATTRQDSLALLTPRSDTAAAAHPIRFTIKGYTVDVQAMTRMMEELEQSPFIQDVQLVGSKSVTQAGSTVTEFTLQAAFEPADSVFVKRSAFTVSSR